LRKALVVDDDSLIASSVTKYLASQGYDVASFPDAHSCVSSLPCTGPCTFNRPCADAIVTDLRMPGMSGLSLIDLLRSRKCKIPRMAIMSGTGRDEIPRFADAECAYFEKPLEFSDLLSWLSSDRSVRFTSPLAEERGEA
jgi:two-component system C4-dicarboxylate transport response regulator DctD